MSKFISNDGSGSGFLVRFAKLCDDQEKSRELDEKSEFDVGYRKGNLRLAVAHKYMPTLKFSSLDSYLEEKNGLSIVWQRQGDKIIRVENDNSWIDELLNLEGNR